MCASAIIHARVARLVFGAWDPKAGAAGSTTNIFALPSMNHRVDVFGGVLMEESAQTAQRLLRRASARVAIGNGSASRPALYVSVGHPVERITRRIHASIRFMPLSSPCWPPASSVARRARHLRSGFTAYTIRVSRPITSAACRYGAANSRHLGRQHRAGSRSEDRHRRCHHRHGLGSAPVPRIWTSI